ncbi:hypothetical protein [Reyranella sp.]|uniref:hypothetical protein n=1 Tax=Reyranella sp. TaxID=1929291 RepID=UPI003D0D6A43
MDPVLGDPTFAARLKDMGLVPVGSGPQEFGELLPKEIARMQAVLAQLGRRLGESSAHDIESQVHHATRRARQWRRAIQFATLAPGLALTNADFTVI